MSGLLGFLLGLMPVLKYGIPLILIPFSILWMIKNSETPVVRLGLFGVQYCLLQVFLIIWHSHSSGSALNLGEQNLLIIYATTALLVVPFAGFVYAKFGQVNVGIYVGIWLSISVLAIDYFYIGKCRAVGFSSNPLIPPFILIPLFGYFAAKRLVDGRSGVVDFLITICLVAAVSALGGNRMAFYILIISHFISICYTLWARNFFKSILIFCALSVGIVLSILIDSYSGCNFWDRIHNQTAIISADFDFLDDVEKVILDDSANSEEMPKTEHSTLHRMVMWKNSIQHLENFGFEWILGVGRAGEVEIANEFTDTSYSHVHNQYLSWILEGGLVGIFSAFLLFGALPFVAFRSFPVFIFMFAIATGFLTNSLMLSGEASSQMILLVTLVQVLEWRRDRQ